MIPIIRPIQSNIHKNQKKIMPIVGKVKWFNNEKKYGFILIDGREVFVHFSAILKEGYKTLKKDQIVECDIVKGAKGEMAVNVKALSERKLSQQEEAFFLRPTATNLKAAS